MNFENFNWDVMKSNIDPSIIKKPSYEPDSRFWKLSKDENGNGQALIRLLPDKTGTPFIRQYFYGLKKPNPLGGDGKKGVKWYIKPSPESIKLPDPVKEYYSSLMAEGTQEAQKEAEKYRRQTKYITNILVIKDPKNPENNGKVFLWEFGNMLKDKFLGWINPTPQAIDLDEVPKELYNPLAKGCDVLLKIKPKGEFSTYEDTQAREPSPAFQSKQEAIDFIEHKTYVLKEFLDPSFYEPYDKLKADFEKFLGKPMNISTTATTVEVAETKVAPAKVSSSEAEPEEWGSTVKIPESMKSDDNDDWLNELA